MNHESFPREGPSVVFYRPPGEEISDDKVLRTLCRHFLPDFVELFFPELAPDLDFTKSRPLNGKFFDSFRKKGHMRPDVAVHLMTRDEEPESGVFHAEFENRFTSAMEKRLKVYFHQIALEHDDPAVISVVFSKHGGTKAVEEREVVRRLKTRVSNRFYYLAVCLSKCRAEDYVGRPQAVAPALASLMSSKVWDRVEQKLRCLEAVARRGVDNEKRYLLTNVIDLYLDLDDQEEVRFQQELGEDRHEEVKKMILTWEEAIADSEARGEARGEAKGKDKARKAAVLVAEHRWGTPPDDFVAKLAAIDDLDRLHRIMEQVLKVDSLDEIDGDL